VGYGDRTVDEMAHAWMNVVYLNDDEYKALVARERPRQRKPRRLRHDEATRRRRGSHRRGRLQPAPCRQRSPLDFARGEQLPNEPFRQFGTSVTGAFEGWFPAPDGTRYFLIGYLNRNNNQAVDVPIGPNNHIDPGGPDMGQPTHFLPGRHWGMFVVKVPAEFTTPDQRLTWTIVVNGQSTVIPLRLHPDYSVSPVHRRRRQEHAADAAIR
jgi:hypothetical protein